MPAAVPPPRAILFDMDGTLTQPLLDFPAIKREIGVGDQPILEALAAMTPDQRASAETILHRHEDEAARSATLNDGCEMLLHWLEQRGIPTAIITRNSRSSAAMVCALHSLRTAILITRDDDLPPKPDPAPLLAACRHLNVAPADAWMVGDGEFDVAAGNAAGIPTIWISHHRPRPFSAIPTHTLPDLPQLLHLLTSTLA